jgi:hypothetical protein
MSVTGTYAYTNIYSINDAEVQVSNSTVTVNNSTIIFGENNTFPNLSDDVQSESTPALTPTSAPTFITTPTPTPTSKPDIQLIVYEFIVKNDYNLTDRANRYFVWDSLDYQTYAIIWDIEKNWVQAAYFKQPSTQIINNMFILNGNTTIRSYDYIVTRNIADVWMFKTQYPDVPMLAGSGLPSYNETNFSR